jgi:hypothetical protein
VLAPSHFLRSPPRCPNCQAIVGPKISFLVLVILVLSLGNAFAAQLARNAFVGSVFIASVASSLLLLAILCTLAYFFAPLEVFPEPKKQPPSTPAERLYAAIAVLLVVGFIVWLFVANQSHGG